MAVTIRDKDIITKSFRLLTNGEAPSELLDQMDWDRYFNVFSSATGDNRYINPIAQSSPSTDPRYGRLMESSDGGFGSIYKEVYEDNVTLLTLTPSVPQFAGLLSFITNMFSPTAAIIANKGRAPGIAFYIGQAAGSIAFWQMQLVSISVQFLAFLMDSPKNDFWTAKPAMGAYVMSATGILNDFMVKLGYIDPVLPKRTQQQTDPMYGLKPDYDNSKAVSDMNLLMPDCVNSDGTIDLMRLIMKGTRKHRVMLSKLAEMDNEILTTPVEKLERAKQLIEEIEFDQSVISGSPTQEYVEKEMGSVGKHRGDAEGNYIEQDSAYLNQKALENIYNADQSVAGVSDSESGTSGSSGNGMTNMSSASSYGTDGTQSNPNESTGRSSPASPSTTGDGTTTGQTISYEDDPNDRTWAGDVYDLVKTAIAGGLDAITFRVDGAVGPTTDSFSNTHTKSPMAEKFNSVVKSVNDFRFDVAGGNLGIDIVDGIVNTIKEGAIGALSGTVIGNIPLALANNSYVKIADHWDGSTANLHSESYSLYFDCTYAHPYEQIMKIWVPFSLFLGMVASHSAGGSTYTSPFMLKAFCQGRTVIRTGMMSRCSFTLGAGDAGWTRDRKPLNLRIDCEIVDLEGILSVPIDRSLSLLDLTNPSKVVERMFSNDTAYNNFTSRVTGTTYLDTILRYSRLNRGLTEVALEMQQSIRADNIAAKVSDSMIADLFRITTRPITR